MRGEMKTLSMKVTGDVQTIRNDLASLRGNYDGVKDELEALRSENRDLKKQLNGIEGHSRRNNLVVTGIAESRVESWEETEGVVRKAMHENLKLPQDCVDSIHIERAHRISNRNRQTFGRYCRDIMVKFAFFKDKQKILMAARKEKPTGVYCREDFTQAVRQIRFKLTEKMTAVRDAGYGAFLSHDKLIVTNTAGKRNAYTYDTERDSLMTLFQNFDDTPAVPNGAPRSRDAEEGRDQKEDRDAELEDHDQAD